jgi:hypothetical protein
VGLQAPQVAELLFPRNQFAPALNKHYAFFMDGISDKPLKPDLNEIARAAWVDIEDIVGAGRDAFIDGMLVTQAVNVALKAALNGSGLKPVLTVDETGSMIICAVST